MAALSHVVRAYNRLAIDNSRRVRELAQRSLEMTAGRVGREIAPHLRSLLPIWILSMNDMCAGVSNAARFGFEATFPTEAKQNDALWLARREICSVLSGILLHPKDCTLLREDPAKVRMRASCFELMAFRIRVNLESFYNIRLQYKSISPTNLFLYQ